jgi:group I intron endonuclease
MEKTWTVYMHTNKINNKVYVGITCQDVNQRWRNGKGYFKRDKDGKFTQPKFARAIKKYGWDNFEHIIFAEDLNHNDACSIEKLLIAIWDTRNHGYNITLGGEGTCGCTPSEETKQLLRETKGKAVCQLDTDLNFIKEYPSIKFAEKCTGIWESMVKGCCDKLIGYKTAGGFVWIYKDDLKNLDKQEYKAWLKHEKLPKPVCQFSLNMDFIKEYPSIGDAGRQLNISYVDISVAASGKVFTSHGYIWIFKEDYEKMKHGEIPFRKPYIDSRYRRIIQYTLNGEFIQEFESRIAAGQAIGVTPQAIGYACNSKTHKCKNYLFKYKGE